MFKAMNLSVVILLSTLIALLAIIPFFKVFSVFNVILFTLSISCSILIFGLHWRMNQKLSLIWYVTHISFGYIFFFALLTKNVALVGRFSEYLILANSLQVLLYCQFNSLENELSSLVKFSILAVALSCITTLIGHSTDPAASRMVSDNPELYGSNIGGYGFIYCLLFFIIAIQSTSIPGGWSKKGAISWLCIVIILAATLFSSRFLIAGMLAVGLLMTSYFTKRSPFNFGGPILWICVGLSSFLSVVSLVFWLYQNESYLILKSYEILLAAMSNSDSSYLTERLAKYIISWQGFVEFPVFGVLAGGGEVFDWQWYGRHSFILDNFALFGLFGGFAFLFILLYPWIMYRRRLGLDSISTLQAALVILLLGITNILTPEILIAAYLILPATALLNKKEPVLDTRVNVI